MSDKIKGQFIAVYTGVMVGLLGVVIIVAALGIFFVVFGPGRLEYNAEIVSAFNRPYILSEALTHLNIENRNLMDHSVRAMYDRKIDDKKKALIRGNLDVLLDRFGINYDVSLRK